MFIHANKSLSPLICGILLQASCYAQVKNLPPTSKANISLHSQDYQPIIIKFVNKPFAEVSSAIEQQSNIKIQIAPFLKNHLITADIRAKNWETAIAQLLKYYNRAGFINKNGRTSRIIVTGINGNGSGTITSPPTLFNYSDNVNKLPEHLKMLPNGSVIRINFNKSMLQNMELGDILSLAIPSGKYNVVHDNFLIDKNGDFTWVGYLEGELPKSRVILSFDNKNSFGRIQTPDGVFRVETAEGADWLIDVDSAGLSPESLRADAITNHPLIPAQRSPEKKKADTQNPPAKNNLSPTITIIDVMVLYTEGIKIARIKNLLAISNQAFKDSHVKIQLRLVHTQRINYPILSLNETALYDLSLGRNIFSSISALRSKHGVDLTSLVRPFDANAHQGCGLAWIGGSGGRNFNPLTAYSVVSDGIDGNHYCTDYTFVHEIGHNMGSSHDRVSANTQGRFTYSYGYNVNKHYGTIMSYPEYELGLFSNPDISCIDQPCGIDSERENAANNALSLNNSAKEIAGFMKSVYKKSLSTTKREKSTLAPSSSLFLKNQ